VSTYSELLKDPRWHARKWDVLLKSGFKCQECGLETDDLQIHHRYYRAGAKPWEYADDELACLCRDCHELITDELERVHRAVGQLPIKSLPLVVSYCQGLLAREWTQQLPKISPEHDDAE